MSLFSWVYIATAGAPLNLFGEHKASIDLKTYPLRFSKNKYPLVPFVLEYSELSTGAIEEVTSVLPPEVLNLLFFELVFLSTLPP